MINFEKETIEFLNELPLELRERLVEIIEWEKELSWSNGYADAKKDEPKSEPYNMDVDEKDFENALESDGFSSYVGSSLEGVSTFGDDGGNVVAVAAGSVYNSESAFVVSGFNEDDPVDVIQTKEFDSKDDAIAYAKEVGQELKG